MRQGQEGLIDLHHRADVSRNKGEVAWGGVGEEKCGMMYPLAIQSHLENVYCRFFFLLSLAFKGGGGCALADSIVYFIRHWYRVYMNNIIMPV